MIGSASRFVTGPRSAMRPNAHATSGAVTAVATMLIVPAVASARRHPLHFAGTIRRESAPPAISAAVPATLNCQPRSTTVGVSHSGAAAPSASTAHGDVGRCRRRVTRTTASITAARTAGGGAPMAATYTVSKAMVATRAGRCGRRRTDARRSSASATMPTCRPETLSMWTRPARAYRSRSSTGIALISAMTNARTIGASVPKMRSMRAPEAARARDNTALRPTGSTVASSMKSPRSPRLARP